MPVSVSLPIKVRVDRASLGEHQCSIEEAVSSAVGRAIANSREAVLDARGGFVGVSLHHPTFTWSGLALAEQDRAHLEEMISDLISQAAQREEILPVRQGSGAEVLPDHPYEIYDDERGSRFLGLYTLDSYDGGQVDVSVAGGKRQRLSDNIVETVDVFTTIDDPEALAALDMIAIDARDQRRPLGIIYRVAAPGRQPGWQVAVTDGTVGVVSTLWFREFLSRKFMGFNADPMFKEVRNMPPVGPATAEIVELPSDPDARKNAYMNLFGEDLIWGIRRWSPKKVSMTTSQYNKAVNDAVAREIERGLLEIGQCVAALIVKMSGSRRVFYLTREQRETFKWNGSAKLEVLTVFKPRTGQDKQKKPGTPGGTGTESSLMFAPEAGGTGDCPKDDIPQDKWGGFLNEPALDEIGDAGVLFVAHMAEIATALAIEQGRYAGEFCCRAAEALEALAETVVYMDESGIGENKPAAGGNLGSIDFTPGQSAIIAAVRDYAQILVKISKFVELIDDTFNRKYYACAIHGIYRGNGAGWCLHFKQEVIPTMKWVVYRLFVGGCRSMLIQLLVTSESEIRKRQAAMDRYAPLFEQWIVPQITELAELETMQRKLEEHQRAKYLQPLATVTSGAVGQDWLLATNRLLAAISGPTIVRAPGDLHDVVTDGGVDKIRGPGGVLWSKDDIVKALEIKRGTAEGIDPLVKQITDTPEAVERFKGSTAIRVELENLLAEMLGDNIEMQGKAASRPMFGFGASQRIEDTPHATVEHSSWRLDGIHKLTHDAIGDAFGGRRIYATGIDFLFDSEEGKASLLGFGLMVGMIALSVLVPGSGFLALAAGAATAAHQLAGAYERKRLYRALIDPDLVLSHAEVEVGLFVAWFGAAVSVIPGAGSATKALGAAIARREAKAMAAVAARAGAAEAGGAVTVARAALSPSVVKEVTETTVNDLLEAFVKEMVMDVVMDQIIGKLLSPVIDDIAARAAMIRPGGAASGGTAAGDDDGEQAFIAMIRGSRIKAMD